MEIKDMTIQQLQDMGASIQVSFHRMADRDTAGKTVEQLTGAPADYLISPPSNDVDYTVRWAVGKSCGVEVVAFYTEAEVAHG